MRPLNPLFQVIVEKFQPDGFGEIIIGIILVATSWIKLNLDISIGKIISLIVVILFATLIYTAIKLAVTSIAFWVKFAQSYLFMIYQISTFVKYPITIYPNWIRGVLTFIIPFAFTGYFPSAYFLGRESYFNGILLTCIVGVISLFIAYRIWLIGMKKYESSGS